MNDRAQKREEFERLWKDPAHVRRWNRQRRGFLRSLRQREFQDADGAWQRDPLPDPIEPVKSSGRRSADQPNRRRKKGDPEFKLPGPTLEDGQLRFLSAERAGASSAQLEQAEALYRAGLKVKALRKAHCGVLGQRRDCSACADHKFYAPYRCGTRYCVICGKHSFAQLFTKYLGLESTAHALVPEWPVRRGRRLNRVIAKIDFTIQNTGEMPTPEDVRKFNEKIKTFFRLLERRLGISRKDYGVICCNEFGGSNTNLHSHGVYVGPWLPQRKKELSALWSEVVGQRAFVSIKPARSFRGALAHALKYPAKFVSYSTPQRLAQLEKAFHRVRRVHAFASFYNVKPGDAPDPATLLSPNSCPLCGFGLVKVSGYHLRPIGELEKEGIRSLEEVRREVGRDKVFGGPRGSPSPARLITNNCAREIFHDAD